MTAPDPVTAAHNAAIDAAAEVATTPPYLTAMQSAGYRRAIADKNAAILALRRPDPPAAMVAEPWDGKPPGDPSVSTWHWLEYRRTGYIERRPFRWEKDGWWVDAVHRHHREWVSPGCFGEWRYLGPCGTPADLAAAEARARDVERMREALKVIARRTGREPTDGGYRIVEAPEAAIARAALGTTAP